jgi:hypothetical protein|tara:strand:+ start:416 stop:634 length:219 start_codon:yes stop_codon:yes gene_type:complete
VGERNKGEKNIKQSEMENKINDDVIKVGRKVHAVKKTRALLFAIIAVDRREDVQKKRMHALFWTWGRHNYFL